MGNFYLSDKEGDAGFTPEDEGMLALFASQAALAIANARRYREEQRARADLETLVNTSPVGVALFDARTGAILSINREARRIVDGLLDPGQTLQQLLEVLTFRRADGQEVSLEEFPPTRALSTGETVRAEEIVIQVPDGRRINTIINATPIISDEGEVESVVVTVQDLAPLKELGRQRAEFLGLVSQELLAPLTSIKGSAAVLEDLARLDLTKAGQFFRIIEWQADRMRGLIWDLLDMARIEAGTLFLAPEPTDLASLVGQARAAFLAGEAVNQVEVDLPPDLPQVAADRQRSAWPGGVPGHRGGPRGPHPGRKRRAGPGVPVHLHPAGGGADRAAPGRTDGPVFRRQPAGRPRAGARAGGGRRPPGALARPQRPDQGGLH